MGATSAGRTPIRSTIEEFPVFRHHLGALALLAAFALPLAASAQTVPAPGASAPAATAHHHHRRHHHNRYFRAMSGLGLSAAQKQQIAGILKTARGANKNADPQTRRANARALHQQVEGVLTDSQRSQLHAKLAQDRGHGAKPNGPAPQAPPQ
jgi:Spy/CpxP family protein refolding chaperone